MGKSLLNCKAQNICFDLVCVTANKHERPLPLSSPGAICGERNTVYNICATIRELQKNLCCMGALKIIWFSLPPISSKQGQLQS